MLMNFPRGVVVSAPVPCHDDDLDMDYLKVNLLLPNQKVIVVHCHKSGFVRAKCGNIVSGELDEGGLQAFIGSMLCQK